LAVGRRLRLIVVRYIWGAGGGVAALIWRFNSMKEQ
jgi:hypothetical protein